MKSILLVFLLAIGNFLMANEPNVRALITDDWSNDFERPVGVDVGTEFLGKIETGRDFDIFLFELKEADGIVVDIKQTVDNGWVNFKIFKQKTVTDAMIAIATANSIAGKEATWASWDIYHDLVKDDLAYELSGKAFGDKYESFSKNLSAGKYFFVAYSSTETYTGQYSLYLKSYGATTSLPAPPSTTDCNSLVMAKVVSSGWNLVGTSTTGCSFDGLKSKGAKIAYTFKNGQWVTDGTISSYSGIWIMK